MTSSSVNSKIAKDILVMFGFSDNCQGCEAAASGADARRHADECRKRLEKLIREDDVLNVRLYLRDVWLSRDAACEEAQSKEELNVDDLMEETEAAGDSRSNKVPQGDVAEKMGQVNKRLSRLIMKTVRESVTKEKETRRRLRMVATEQRPSERIQQGCLSGLRRQELNRMVNALEFGAKTGCTIDVSGILGTLQEEEMERKPSRAAPTISFPSPWSLSRKPLQISGTTPPRGNPVPDKEVTETMLNLLQLVL